MLALHHNMDRQWHLVLNDRNTRSVAVYFINIIIMLWNKIVTVVQWFACPTVYGNWSNYIINYHDQNEEKQPELTESGI